ncbi:MAG: hypothetical protein JW829_20855 [Pirellulales bacterium]|nr:hypothetical protein [Pirellulales bacterium]
MRYATIIIWCYVTCSVHAGPVASFADIEFWAGSGSNEAALVVDWVENSSSDESLAWGYRWDGNAYGEDILMAIVEADPRLFIKIQGWGGDLGIAVYGIGYDDGDGDFALDDGTSFDSNGIAVVSGPADGALAIDGDDVYAEGWFTGFWHYGLSDGNPYSGGSWSSSQLGASSQVLADGDWNSWAYTPTCNFAAFAENPVAAFPSGNADFDSDGDVDGGDFLAWQAGFGILDATHEDGDADLDRDVDGDDFLMWQREFGQGGSGKNTPRLTSVPEPTAVSTLALCTLFVFFGRLRQWSRP